MDGISLYLRQLPLSFQLQKATALPMEPTPEFGKICVDVTWIKVLRARWDEAERCIAADAPVMAIVALGSVLEGALKATAERFPRDANQANKAPKDSLTGKTNFSKSGRFTSSSKSLKSWAGSEQKPLVWAKRCEIIAT